VGNSGLTVSRLCLGSMYFGGTTPDADALDLMKLALDSGINFWDTSNLYNNGRSEEVVGRGLKELNARDQVVLATKVFYPRGDGPNDQGLGRRHIVQELDAQLKRLQTDWIDIYYLHRPDFSTPLEETLGTLDSLVRSGKIRYWGFSTFPAWLATEAWWRCDRRGWAAPICEQAPYNLLDRRVETDRVAFLRAYSLGLTTWSSLAGGLLTGKYRARSLDEAQDGTRLADMRERYRGRVGTVGLAKATELADLAGEAGLHPSELAIAWQFHQEVVTAAVIGPRTAGQLGPYLTAVDTRLDDAVLRRIDEIVPPGSAVMDFHDTSGWHVGPLSHVPAESSRG
jgi:aryl-alcohol dehydrogenase-like predicted oxidoreductase